MVADDKYEGFYISTDEPASEPKQIEKKPAASADPYEGFKIDSSPIAQEAGQGKSQTPSGVPIAKPTMRQVARTAPATPTPELTLGEASQRALKNLPSSAAGVLKSTASAVLNPAETLEGLKQIGRGAISKAKGAVGIEQSAEEKKKDEAVLNAIINQYKQTYGSEQGFLRALAEDPASIAMDFSTLLTGGAGALGKAGVIGEKAATTAAKAASFLDPVQVALKTAKTVTSPVPKAMAMVGAITTGKSYENLKRAAQVASEGTQEQRSAFLRQSSADADQREILDAAEDALKQARDKRSNEYMAQMAKAKTGIPQFDYNSTLKLLSDLDDKNTTLLSSGVRHPKRLKTRDALQEMLAEISVLAKEPPGSAGRTLDGADGLKRRIGEIQAMYRNDPDAYRVATEIYNSIGNDIKSKSPDYAKAMSSYEEASELINDARMTMGVGNRRLSDETVLRRLLNQKTPQKKMIVEELAQFNPQLPFLIAGAELRDLLPGGPQQLLGGSLAALQYSLVHPLAPIVQAVASSPKVAGRTAYGIGRIGAAGRAATSQKVTTPAYFAGVAREEAANTQPVIEPQDSAAATEGVVPAVVEQIRKIEGEGQNPASSARGPFQFVDQTFVDAFRKFYPDQAQSMSRDEILDLKNSPEGASIAEQMGPMLIEDNANIIGRAGYDTTPGNVYLAHFLGAGDALKVLNADPSTPVDQLLPAKVISANERLLRGKTAGEVREMMEQMMQPAAASGGRIERRTGGRVDSVDGLVDELMNRVRKAKRETQKITEPLLDQPDEHIVKALDVAQQAI